MSTPPTLRVACAILVRDGAILVAQRPEGKANAGTWEFPGGKIEPGEEPEAALEREIREELGCEIRVTGSLTPVTHVSPHVIIELIPFLCELQSGEPVALENQAIRWLQPAEFETVDWQPADIPIVEELLLTWGRR